MLLDLVDTSPIARSAPRAPFLASYLPKRNYERPNADRAKRATRGARDRSIPPRFPL